MTDRRALRRDIRRRRRALPAQQRRALERSIHHHARGLLRFRWRFIAGYAAFDGEPDISPLLRQALCRGRRVFLPRLVPGRVGRMDFLPWNDKQRAHRNPFGIAEPQGAFRRRRDPRQLDLVLVPLVGWDSQGTRLGIGAGYYDRAFRFLLQRRLWRRPRLVGVAFDCQRVKHLERAAWDVPLWGIVTESGVHRFPHSSDEEPQWPTG